MMNGAGDVEVQWCRLEELMDGVWAAVMEVECAGILENPRSGKVMGVAVVRSGWLVRTRKYNS